MDKPRQPQSCVTREGLHKRGYRSRASARKAARSAQADIGRVSVYKATCGYYHLGHSAVAK